jgi:hypothetical protein
MSNFAQQALSQLHSERGRVMNELKRLDEAIDALKGLAKFNGGGGMRRRPRLSAAARARIAAAQRARWAKVRQQQKRAA